MPAADHREALVRAEIDRPVKLAHGLLAGVDQIGIDLVGIRKRADAEHAVFGLQRDIDAVGDVVGDQRRDTDPKVDIISVAQRSEEHTSELQSLMRISYAVFCLKKQHNINSIQQNKYN